MFLLYENLLDEAYLKFQFELGNSEPTMVHNILRFDVCGVHHICVDISRVGVQSDRFGHLFRFASVHLGLGSGLDHVQLCPEWSWSVRCC